MREQILFRTAWLALFAALMAMLVGHAGSMGLNPVANQISTYAAHAPHHAWVTVGIILPCLTLACIGMLASRHKMLGDGWLAHLVPQLAGAASSGLLMLAVFKEAVPDMAMLRHASVDNIIQESFHNAGLMIFFYSALALVILGGGLTVFHGAGRRSRLMGSAVILLGLATQPLMLEPWPQLLGVPGETYGLQQRASLLSLWLGAALVLLAARPLSRVFGRQ